MNIYQLSVKQHQKKATIIYKWGEKQKRDKHYEDIDYYIHNNTVTLQYNVKALTQKDRYLCKQGNITYACDTSYWKPVHTYI